MNISWDDSYCIGHSTIDAQHKEFFKLAEVLVNTTDVPGIKMCFVAVYTHTREHFEAEEYYMRSRNYPLYEEHCFKHIELLTKLGILSATIGKNTYNLKDIHDFIFKWILEHVLQEDKKFASYLNSNI